MARTELRDEFLSEEDWDLRSLTDEEPDAVWSAWFYQAQITNDEDRFTYLHGVFTHEPARRGRLSNLTCVRHGSVKGRKLTPMAG